MTNSVTVTVRLDGGSGASQSLTLDDDRDGPAPPDASGEADQADMAGNDAPPPAADDQGSAAAGADDLPPPDFDEDDSADDVEYDEDTGSAESPAPPPARKK